MINKIKSSNDFKQVIKELNGGVYDFTVDGKCCCCGACCSNFLPLSDAEVRKIKKYIISHGLKPHVHGNFLTNPTIDMVCPFMDESKELKCDIYEVRPMVCRMFICNPKGRLKPPHLKTSVYDVRNTFFTEKNNQMELK